ncbi:MAG: EF-P beta-lysylation protein EpmB [Gammaproteobacteria bacterium]|nr:EF-P beta-lysylation protein EpmB [Gammaproteobacteria bacterium]
MIARSQQVVETADWRAQLRDAYRSPAQLLADLGIAADAVALAPDSPFPFRVTRAFAARMRPGDVDDALLRQVLPLSVEDEDVAGYSADPLQETSHYADGALIRKYQGRALLMVTGACAIHCRYCFRREFPYGESVGNAALSAALGALAADTSLHEVILSGGDPLVLDDAQLASLVTRLDALPHVRRLRIHSRLPVVLPARITSRLLDVLATARMNTALVIHANHAQELDSEVRAALAALKRAGVTLLNQAVLLRGVNDDAMTLAALCETLFEAGVLPYYVHVLDRVRGTAHFDAGDLRAAHIEQALRARLPGYLVPRFVREVPGADSKLPLSAL